MHIFLFYCINQKGLIIMGKSLKVRHSINCKGGVQHCFRHTFAARYLEAGVPLKTVSALLGHAQLQLTTDLYMHVTSDSLFKDVGLYERAMQIG